VEVKETVQKTLGFVLTFTERDSAGGKKKSSLFTGSSLLGCTCLPGLLINSPIWRGSHLVRCFPTLRYVKGLKNVKIVPCEKKKRLYHVSFNVGNAVARRKDLQHEALNIHCQKGSVIRG